MEDLLDIHTHRPEQDAVTGIYNCGITYTPDRAVSVGIHPWNITHEWEETFRTIETAATAPNVVAIGECGIDKIKSSVDIETQKKAFYAHVLLSERVCKPLIIHCVKAFDEIIAIRKESSPSQAWIIHGFRGKPQQALQLVGNGFHISLGEHFNPESAKAIPMERLFIESDESTLHISEIYSAVAAAKGVSVEDFANKIKENSRIFGQYFTF